MSTLSELPIRQQEVAAVFMVDANNAYSLAGIEALLELDRLGLMMIEQPLAWDDLLRHAELQKQMQTPICLDESITSVERAQDMFRLGSGKIVNIKPGRVGGLHSSRQIHDFCQHRSIPVWCGGMLESGIGRAHNVALASLPNFSLPGDLSPSSRYWERDIVTPEWTMNADGEVAVPWDKPGIGVEVDLDRIDDLTPSATGVGFLCRRPRSLILFFPEGDACVAHGVNASNGNDLSTASGDKFAHRPAE